MSIYHAKTVTIADDPLVVAAGGVVPSDYNAAHIIGVDGTTIHTHSNKSDLDSYSPASFAGSNHTHSQYLTSALTDANQFIATSNASNYQPAGAYLTTAALSNHAHGFTGVNATGTFDSNGLSLSVAVGGGAGDGYNPIMVSGSTANSTQNVLFNNSNGISFGLNGSVLTASHNGYTGNTTQFLTTAMQSNAGTDFVAAGRSTEWATSVLSGTSNNLAAAIHTHSQYQSTGVYLTTAAQSNHSHALATTTTNGSQVIIATSNSNGATIAVPSFITTYAAQTVDTNKVGVGGVSTVSTAGTNISGSAGTNGLTLAVPNYLTIAAGAGDGYNIVGVNGGGTSLSATLQLSNSNNVSFGMNAGTITASASFNQTTPTQFAGTATGATNVGLTVGSTGISVSAPSQTVQTQGMVSINGSTGALTGIQLSSGAMQTGERVNYVPIANSTQYATSVLSGSFALTSVNFRVIGIAGSNASTASGNVQFANGNNVTFGLNGNTITASASFNQTTPTQFAGTSTGATNASITVNSNGINISVAAPGAAAENNWFNLAGNTLGASTVSGSTIQLIGGNNITLSGLNASQIQIVGAAGGAGGAGTQFSGTNISGTVDTNGISLSVNAGGGAAGTLGGWEVVPANGASAGVSLGQRSVYFQKMIPEDNYSFNNFELKMSNSMVTTALASAAVSYTIFYGLYSLNTNNSYQQISTSSMFMAGSNSSSNSMGITVSQGGNSFTSNASTATIAPLMSGYKHFYLPFTSTLTVGGSYAFAIMASSTTVGNTNALRLAFVNQTIVNNITVGKIYGSTVLASNSTHVGDYAQGVYNSTTSAMPAAVAKSQMTNALSQGRLMLQLEV